MAVAMSASFNVPPVRWNSTLVTPTMSEALASRYLLPVKKPPFEGMRTLVAGAIVLNAYRVPLLSPI